MVVMVTVTVMKIREGGSFRLHEPLTSRLLTDVLHHREANLA